jgi:hypothetical protein
VTRDSTAIADRITMRAGPFAHCRRVPRTTATAPSLRPGCLAGRLRRCAGSTTRSQPPTCSGQLIEVGLAQVEFVAGGAVVHSNRRHGLGAVTVNIAGKHDTRCLSHSSSLQRHTSDEPLARNPTATIDLPSQRLTNQPPGRMLSCSSGGSCQRRPTGEQPPEVMDAPLNRAAHRHSPARIWYTASCIGVASGTAGITSAATNDNPYRAAPACCIGDSAVLPVHPAGHSARDRTRSDSAICTPVVVWRRDLLLAAGDLGPAVTVRTDRAPNSAPAAFGSMGLPCAGDTGWRHNGRRGRVR